jgi:formyl-CoA transferase
LNNIVVPLEGAGGKLTSTISSPIQVHGVTKVSAKRAPDIGEHNDEVLKELGFSATEVAGLYTSGVVTKSTQPVAAATKPGASPATASKPTSTAAIA